MNRPNVFRPTKTGAEHLFLRVSSGVFDPLEDTKQRHDARLSAMDGLVPGFAQRGGLSSVGALEYATTMQKEPGGIVEKTGRITLVQSAQDEILGLAVYGDTATDEGVHDRMSRGLSTVHIPTFAVVAEIAGQPMTGAETEAIGNLLLHETIVDADAHHEPHDRVSYNGESMNYDWIVGQLERRQVPFENQGSTASFTVTALSETLMFRSLLSASAPELRTSLAAEDPWIVQQPAVTG